MKNHIVIIDDEENLSFFLKMSLEKEGYRASVAHNIEDGYKLVRSEYPDLMLLDLNLTDGYGLDLYRRLKTENIAVPTIVLTAHGSVQAAIDAMKLGVDDFLAKPFDLKEVLIIIEKLLERFHLQNQLNYYRRRNAQTPEENFFISKLPEMEKLQELALRIAEVPTATVLIEGATGTGKEMLARFIHGNSPQAEAPFVEINCASLPANLLESELFGYEPGAFTDARKRKIGLIELAKNGTLFLDEIGEMDLQLQAKMLRFIENRSFKRLGGVHDIRVDLRIIAATNRDMAQMVQEKNFREDLYFRLNLFHLRIPPLSERSEELMLMAQFILDKQAQKFKKPVRFFSEDSRKLLLSYGWPGNIRELNNVLERAVILSPDDSVHVEHLPGQVSPTIQENLFECLSLTTLGNRSLKAFLNDVERQMLEDALRQSNGNQVQAANLLNEERHILRYLLKKHNIDAG
jgi:two-component system response regulator AtoC